MPLRLDQYTPANVANDRAERERRERLGESTAPGFLEGAAHAILSESAATSIAFGVQRLAEPTHASFPGVWGLPQAERDALFDGLPTEYRSEFIGARSHDHARLIAGQLRQLVHARGRLAEMGASGTALRVGAAVLDPAFIAGGVVGTAGKIGQWASRGTRVERLTRSGVVAAGVEVPLETARAAMDPEASAVDVAYSVAGILGFAGTVGGVGSAVQSQKIARAAAREARQIELNDSIQAAMGAAASPELRGRTFAEAYRETMTPKGQRRFGVLLTPEAKRARQLAIIDSMSLDDESKAALALLDPDDLHDTLRRGTVMGSRPSVLRPGQKPGDLTLQGVNLGRRTSTTAVGDWIARKNPLSSDSAKVLRVEQPEVRGVGRLYLHDALADAAGVTQRQSAITWKRTTAASRVNRYAMALQAAHKKHLAEGGPLDFDTFRRQSTRAMRDGFGEAPGMREAVEATGDFYEEFLELAKRHGTPGFEDIPADRKYLPRLLSAERFNFLVARYGEEFPNELVSTAIRAANPDIDADEAMAVARSYVRVARQIDDFTDFDRIRALSGERIDLLRSTMDDLGIEPEQADQIASLFRPGADEATNPRARTRTLLDESASMTAPDGTVVSFQDLIEDDLLIMADRYADSVAGAAAHAEVMREASAILGREVGSFEQMRHPLTEKLVAAGNTPADAEKVIKRLDQADKVLRGQRLDTDDTVTRAMQTAQQVSYMALAGGFGAAQVPELAGVVVEAGVSATFRQLPTLKGVFAKARRGEFDEALFNDLGAVFDLENNFALRRIRNRVDEMSDEGNILGRRSPLGRTLQRGSDVLSYASGLAPIQTFMRRTVFATGLQKFVDIARTGKVPSERRLRALGMTKDEAKRIFDAIKDEADAGRGIVTKEDVFGRRVARFLPDEFADQQAAALLIDRMDRYARRVVQTNDYGVLPYWMSREWGRLLMQFQSFHIAAWEKQTLHGFRPGNMTATAMARMVTTSAIGGLVFAGQQYLRSTREDDPQKWREENMTFGRLVAAGVQRGGMSSLVPQIADSSSAAFGIDPIFDARNTGITTDTIPFVGIATSAPSFSVARDLYRAGTTAIQAPLHDDVSARDVGEALIRVTPARNLLGIRSLLDHTVRQLPDEE